MDFVRRIPVDIFEKWYADQDVYRKVPHIPTAEELENDYICLQDAADLLGISREKLAKIARSEEIGRLLDSTICNNKRGITRKSFQLFLNAQNVYYILDDGGEQEKDTAFYREVSEIGEEDTTLVLFVTGACESCQKADQYLQGSLSDKSFHLLIYNILDEENAVILRRLMKIYGVPESGQQVPLLFSRSSYLSGAEKIVNGTVGMLESGEAQGSWKDIIEELAGEKESVKISKSRLAVTGFFNGLNPCGISMLLMVLSILLMSKRSFYGGSFTYLAGKFLTYLLLGFTIGTLFGVIENTLFRTVQKGLELFFAVLAFIFGVFYLIDFIHVLKKEYGRTRFQLPERFRKWNHKMINRLTKIPGQFWYPALFLLGIVISAGEFLCTGQVYLASLLYMVEQNAGFNPALKPGNLSDCNVCADGSADGTGIQGEIRDVGVPSVTEDSAGYQTGIQYFFLCFVFYLAFLRERRFLWNTIIICIMTTLQKDGGMHCRWETDGWAQWFMERPIWSALH